MSYLVNFLVAVGLFTIVYVKTYDIVVILARLSAVRWLRGGAMSPLVDSGAGVPAHRGE